MPNNAAFEYAVATTPAPERDEPDGRGEGFTEADAMQMAARMARELTRRVVEAADGDGTACLMMLMRAGGMTMAEIAHRHGVTKQAVRKRFVHIVGNHPVMAGYLHVESPGTLDTGIAGDTAILAVRTRQHKQMKELTAWIYREARRS